MIAYKIIAKPISGVDEWGYEDKNAVKRGTVMYECEGEINDKIVSFKKGVEVLYQHGTPLTIDEEQCELVNFNQIVCQK